MLGSTSDTSIFAAPRRTSVGAFLIILGLAASASAQTPPSVPSNLQVPDGYSAFFAGHAVGTQNYICMPIKGGVIWKFVAPQATLFDDGGQQLTTHFLAMNPFEADVPRPTWQDSDDTSRVWGKALASSTDPTFVQPNAIPWLLLQVVGAAVGPTGGNVLTPAAYIQRVNTSGGIAPSTGCSRPSDVGVVVLVPYSADYFFYAADQAR